MSKKAGGLEAQRAKMNWPSFSEPEMFAGQKRSKNKELATEILLCLHTPGTLG